MKKFTMRDGSPFTFELACTDALIDVGARFASCWLFTLVDIHLGVVIDAVLIPQELTHPSDFGSFWGWPDFTGEDKDLLTISVPDDSLLTDDELTALPWGHEIRVVRRMPGWGLHPVHEAAIDLLLASARPGVTAEEDGFGQALEELQSYSLYEHVFADESAGHSRRLVASYRHARTGDGHDEHSGHVFDPWCCGIARLRGTHSPRLIPTDRPEAQDFSDLERGA